MGFFTPGEEGRWPSIRFSSVTFGRIVAVHGIRNKSRTIPARDLKIALERKNEWMGRHRHEKENEL